MVRVPKLPLSMVAVVSNTPSSISAADMTSVRPLWLFKCFAGPCAPRTNSAPQEPPESNQRAKSEYGYGHRSKLPTCPRSGEPGSHYRRPPDTDWAAPCDTHGDSLERHAGICATAPLCLGRTGPERPHSTRVNSQY